MTLPSSGQLTLKQIYQEIYGLHTNQQISMRAMSAAAEKNQPDTFSEFYGYSHFTLDPTSLDYDFEGAPCFITGDVDVSINVGLGVRWTIKNYSSWIFPSHTTGTGPDTVGISVLSNSGSARMDSVDVSTSFAVKTFTVSQRANGDTCV